MRRFLFACLLLFPFSTISHSQTKVFCEIVGTQQFLSTKVTVEIDYGQARKLFSDDRLIDENGNVPVFNSMVDAMNYLGARGWEFEQAYAVTHYYLTGGMGVNVYHWLLSKTVSEDYSEEILKTVSIHMKEEREKQKEERAKFEEEELKKAENIFYMDNLIPFEEGAVNEMPLPDRLFYEKIFIKEIEKNLEKAQTQEEYEIILRKVNALYKYNNNLKSPNKSIEKKISTYWNLIFSKIGDKNSEE